ncbi:MGH1-like glycoside hydrolase domain-containing protein [Pollutibacter soli]|uniref:MGH1-like glycoside hydrolase domain-containing protein n=1 Tax=Pollutibacter soli TaxID=3034157 RepID=UPI0030138B23
MELNRDTLAEVQRLKANAQKSVPLELWGPYLSERQWGTVREDYSANGDAWNYVPFDHAHSRVYRWGEDGIAGLSDVHQNLCFAPAFWNHKDPIVKERLFGLTNGQGNHGEDVKELYYYLDNLPTHYYMQYLYKYPINTFPYSQLLQTNQQRNRLQPEYEILDTGVFNDNNYFDILVTYAKADSFDICISLEITNRSKADADLTVAAMFWFRNRWLNHETMQKPQIIRNPDGNGFSSVNASHDRLETYQLCYSGADAAFMTENENNMQKLYGIANSTPFVKDAICDAITGNDAGLVQQLREKQAGTRFSPVYRLRIPAGKSQIIKLRLSASVQNDPFGSVWDETFKKRKAETDEFFKAFTPQSCSADEALIQRQALTGLLWNKQFYHFDIEQWLEGDALNRNPPEERLNGRNAQWKHLKVADVLMMPDKWEYPWFAAWDLCFQCIPMAMIDPVFAKNQLILLCREWYMSPAAHIPAYEWNFGDVNPPIQAWAALQVYRIEKEVHGISDIDFLKRIFQKLMLNFTWWANREDENERNVFTGGFLGMDNIGVIDRNKLPYGTYLEQADATAWMGMYALNMMDMAMEIALVDRNFEDVVTKFYEHFSLIAASLNDLLWDDEEKFFYDLLHTAEGDRIRLKVRSLVGLSVLFNVGIIPREAMDQLTDFKKRMDFFKHYRTSRNKFVPFEQVDANGNILISLVQKDRMMRLIDIVLDENEFLAPTGIRSLSKFHAAHPYSLHYDHVSYTISYCPGDSDDAVFGGNSNWRGPVWMPLNYLIIQTIYQLHGFFGEETKVDFPAHSGNKHTLHEVSVALTERIVSAFLMKPDFTRTVQGRSSWFYQLPENRNLVLFNEFFHGETGEGLGASHQTGWTSLIAVMMKYLALYKK